MLAGVGRALLSLIVIAMVVFGLMGQGASSLRFWSPPQPVVAAVYSASVFAVVTTLEIVMCAWKAVFSCFVQVSESYCAVESRDGLTR